MRRSLPEVNARWQERLGESTEITIGINTGLAQVGNIGSRRKFKYGAFGTTVNQAYGVFPQAGKILLQTEGFELFVRNPGLTGLRVIQNRVALAERAAPAVLARQANRSAVYDQ